MPVNLAIRLADNELRLQRWRDADWYAACSADRVARLTLTLTAPPGESLRLIDALRSLMVPTRGEHGCVNCQLLLSTESNDPSRISYIEDWATEADLREQVRSDRFPRLLEVLEDVIDPPKIEFELDGSTRGLDYAEEVRRGVRVAWQQLPGPKNGEN